MAGFSVPLQMSKVAMQVFGTMPAHRDLSADGVTCRSEGK